jgi:hypothetical protein
MNIWAFINEPSPGEQSNCILDGGKQYYKTIRDIYSGEELLIRYGSRYGRKYQIAKANKH